MYLVVSRIGIIPVQLDDSVKATFESGYITVSGPKGELRLAVPEELTLEINDSEVIVGRKNDEKQTKSIHGTIRVLISNMVGGVVSGYEKILLLEGIGYRAELKGNVLSLQLGRTHTIEVECPEELEVQVNDSTEIIIKGIDKQLVGEFAAKVRSYKKPEPYKGKGIRYKDEIIRRKTPKALSVA